MSETVVPFEVPEQMRAFAEKGVAQARDNYAKLKEAAETSNSTVEAMLTAMTKGAGEYSSKVMEIVKTNTHASFDFAQELSSVKSPSQLMEVWTSHVRKQVETMTAQSKELAELVQKVATEAAEPAKASAAKIFKMPGA